MAVSSRGRTEHRIPQKWDDGEAIPQQQQQPRVVPVVYYLCRHGQLEHPHFMEVPLSSPGGLYLRDVINRLNFLRGKGIASMYSWSSKRSYKNGFVWHDLADNDFIYPAHGQDYILKGSELLESPSNPNRFREAVSYPVSEVPPGNHRAGEDSGSQAVSRRRNLPWSSNDLSAAAFAGKAGDASDPPDSSPEEQPPQSTELSRDEISPPPSDSSPETLESLMKAGGRAIRRSMDAHEGDLDRTAKILPSGRTRTPTVLMQLISCGSISFGNCGVAALKHDHHHLALSSVISTESNNTNKPGLPRGENQVGSMTGVARGFGEVVKLEDRQHFSGSIIETAKDDTVSALKRSSSYDADRGSQMGVGGEGYG